MTILARFDTDVVAELPDRLRAVSFGVSLSLSHSDFQITSHFYA